MGSLNDMVTLNMLKPLQGQTAQGIAPVNVNLPNQPPAQSQVTPFTFDQGFNQTDASAKQSPQPMITASDKNLKTNIVQGDEHIDALLNNLGAYEYEYKDPVKDGKGKFVSTMAQELEKAGPIGKSAVIDTPRGKMVDNGRLVATMLPALALHHQDIKAQSKVLSRLEKDMDTLKKALTKAKRK